MPKGPLDILKKVLRYVRSSGDETLLGHLWPTDYVDWFVLLLIMIIL